MPDVGLLLLGSEAELRVGVLHPQGPQDFDEGTIYRSVLGPASQNTDGQRAALETRQNNACLEARINGRTHQTAR